MNHKPLSLNDFKNWIAGQKDFSDFFNVDEGDEKEQYIGSDVKARVTEQRLLDRIETDDDPESLVREFLEDGGTVAGIEGKKVRVEVESGEFLVPRCYVKIRKK